MDCDENCCRISAISGGAIAVVVVIVILAGAGLLIGLLVDSIDTVNYDEYGLNWSRYTKKGSLLLVVLTVVYSLTHQNSSQIG